MDKLKCPHCERRVFSTKQKLKLSPVFRLKCPECKGLVSVPYTSILAGIPFILSLYYGSIVSPELWGIQIIVGVVIWFYIYNNHVHLIKA